MDDFKRQGVLKRAINLWGSDMQSDIAIEEMAELTQALIKLRRPDTNRSEWIKRLGEEIADVRIMMDQLNLIYGDTKDIEAKRIDSLDARLQEVDNEQI